MKKLKTKHNFFRRPAVIIGLLFTLAALLAGGFWWYSQSNYQSTDNSIDYSDASEEEKQGGEISKEETVETDPQDKSNSTGSDQPSTPSDTTDGKTKVSIVITAANQNGTIYQLRSLIETVASEGTCTLTLTKGTTSVVKTAPTQSNPSTSTCQGFDIPISELAPGTWRASLVFENSTLKGSVEKEITIQ